MLGLAAVKFCRDVDKAGRSNGLESNLRSDEFRLPTRLSFRGIVFQHGTGDVRSRSSDPL